VESTLAVSAAVWAIAMALGPVLQIRRIVDQQSSRGVSISFFVVLLIGFGLWLVYGIAAANLALIIPNTVAAIVMVATIGVAIRYR
jgi:MtN3 and saliva related transmembrane protein